MVTLTIPNLRALERSASAPFVFVCCSGPNAVDPKRHSRPTACRCPICRTDLAARKFSGPCCDGRAPSIVRHAVPLLLDVYYRGAALAHQQKWTFGTSVRPTLDCRHSQICRRLGLRAERTLRDGIFPCSIIVSLLLHSPYDCWFRIVEYIDQLSRVLRQSELDDVSHKPAARKPLGS